jgi:hypothetical protein
MALIIYAQQTEPFPAGTKVRLAVGYGNSGTDSQFREEPYLPEGSRVRWTLGSEASAPPLIVPDADSRIATWDTTDLRPGIHPVTAELLVGDKEALFQDDLLNRVTRGFQVTAPRPVPVSRGDTVPVTLQRTGAPPTRDQALWVAIRNRTNAISFGGAQQGTGFTDFINRVLCQGQDVDVTMRQLIRSRDELVIRSRDELAGRGLGIGAYELLKVAAQAFLLLECGVRIQGGEDEERGRLGREVSRDELEQLLIGYLEGGAHRRLPYLNRIVEAVFGSERLLNDRQIFCQGILSSRVDEPCLLELIWSYWHEEGMLAQTMSVISRRFQNERRPGGRDPLAHLEIAPLRPLNNLLWGYIQDEWSRLSVKRRAYEYDHHYGLSLYGKAVPTLRPADSRSKFLEGFHNLLHLAANFFKEDNDTTVIADGFPLLNALKEVHLLLAQGAHNQFGDLPWTARAEMLIQQWLLARPEMREFLQSRQMVPYREAWMSQVDTMKTLQGWSDVTVTHYHDLGVYGEQILLSVRYGNWIAVNDENQATNWARYWRPEIQGYLHAYRAVTGVDLANAETVDYTMPTVHLQRRLALQQAR